jgi:hypothetical protein
VFRISTLLNHSIAAQRVTQFNASHVASYRDGGRECVCGTTVNKELNLLANVFDTVVRE